MRFKKGFTLAEILIVLMVIGAIATMTLPALMKGVQEAQFKTTYKKAYNTIVNLASMERINGNLPAAANESSALNLFKSLNTNLSVKEYALNTAADSGTVLTSESFNTGITIQNTSYGTTLASGGASIPALNTLAAGTWTPFIVTEDNLAYAVKYVNGATCGTKAALLATNNTDNTTNIENASCAVILVDVNGLTKGPNKLQTQNVAADAGVDTLVNDQYYIYMASDGATAGPKQTTVTGRIVADLK